MADQLDSMRIFVAVADGGGFASAARRLGLSPSIVTRSIAGLEDRLGVRLLQRTTRSVGTTEAGARFLERCRRILADLDEAEATARDAQASPRGRLVISAPLLFGRIHVAPILSRVLRAYTGLQGELVLSDRYVNLVEDAVDVAIRIGALPDSGLVARRLGETRRVLVASPAYLADHGGAPSNPSDLVDYELIAFQSVAPAHEWRFAGGLAVAIAPRFATNSGDAAINHAVEGGGITNALSYQVDEALRDGRLVEVLAAFTPPPLPIQAVFPSARLLPAKTRAFLDEAQRAGAAWPFALSP